MRLIIVIIVIICCLFLMHSVNAMMSASSVASTAQHFKPNPNAARIAAFGGSNTFYGTTIGHESTHLLPSFDLSY